METQLSMLFMQTIFATYWIYVRSCQGPGFPVFLGSRQGPGFPVFVGFRQGSGFPVFVWSCQGPGFPVFVGSRQGPGSRFSGMLLPSLLRAESKLITAKQHDQSPPQEFAYHQNLQHHHHEIFLLQTGSLSNYFLILALTLSQIVLHFSNKSPS